MKKILAILMAMIMVMSVTVVLASNAATTKEEQAEKNDLQIFENKALNVPGEEEFVADEILVKFEPGVGKEKINKINSKHGALVRYTSPYTGTRRVAIPKGKTVPEMVKLYQAEDAVEYAKPNYICRASIFEPNDPYYSYQWHFPLINMPSAWDIQWGGDPSIVVAVLDTGVAYEDYEEFVDNPGRRRDYWITYAQAPDLAGASFVAGYDFINNDDRPNDDDAHGTHVTGTIVQTTNNGYGAAGMASETSIMPVKVLGKGGSGTDQALADGIYYAADNGAEVISMSLSFGSGLTPGQIPDVTAAVDYAYGKGVILVASSGNEGVGVVSLPAAYPQVIAVGAVHSGDERAIYSQYGDALEVVAPGGDDVDRDNNGFGDYVVQETFPLEGDPTDFGIWGYAGTSMAAPHVSGLIALLLAQNSARTQDEIRDILHTTSVDLGASGWDVEYGYGRIDAYAALNATVGPPDDTPPVISGATGDNAGTTGEAKMISATITDDVGVTSATVHYTPIEGVETTVSMTNGADNFWSASVPVASDKVGEITHYITARDAAGNAARDPAIGTYSITVTDNDPPTAEAGPDQSVIVDDVVTFGGSGSFDNIGIVNYSWDFGDGETVTGVTVTHVYTAVDVYTVTLTADDAEGNGPVSDTLTVTVTEEPVLPTMHVASIGMSLQTRGANVNAVATVTIVDADGNPVEGATVYGQWSGLTSDSDSGVTDASGKVALSSDRVRNVSGKFTFTVTEATKYGWTYDESANGKTSDSITA